MVADAEPAPAAILPADGVGGSVAVASIRFAFPERGC